LSLIVNVLISPVEMMPLQVADIFRVRQSRS